MKKYNLSEIMKNAWVIRRRLVINMSAALKKAWAIAKGVKKMLGSEKQVKWATEIRDHIIRTFQAVIADYAPMADTNEMVRENIAGLQARMERLNADNVHAGDIIDLFKDVRFSGNHQEDLGRVLAVYRVGYPNTQGQHDILMR